MADHITTLVEVYNRWLDNDDIRIRGLTMVKGVTRVNPVAKAMMQSRRRTQVVPNKKKYNRKRDKHASEDRQVPHQADKQATDD
jgi:hypothetical protein